MRFLNDTKNEKTYSSSESNVIKKVCFSFKTQQRKK